MNRKVQKLIEQLVEQYLEEAKVDKMIASNPDYSFVLNQFRDVKPKYLTWLLGQFKKSDLTKNDKVEEVGENFVQDLIDEYKKAIEDFEKGLPFLKNKNIETYKDIVDVRKALVDADIAKQKSTEKKEAKSQKDVIYQDDVYLVLEPQSEGASCYYGKGTKWCISATETDNYFDRYSNTGYKFIFIINKQTNDKDALAYNPELVQKQGISTVEIYDAADHRMSLHTFMSKHSDLVDVIFKRVGVNPKDTVYIEDNRVYVATYNKKANEIVIESKQTGFVFTFRPAGSDVKVFMSYSDQIDRKTPTTLVIFLDTFEDIFRPDDKVKIGQASKELIGVDITSAYNAIFTSIDDRFSFAKRFIADTLFKGKSESDIEPILAAIKDKCEEYKGVLQTIFDNKMESVEDYEEYYKTQEKVNFLVQNLASLATQALLPKNSTSKAVPELKEILKEFAQFISTGFEKHKNLFASTEYTDRFDAMQKASNSGTANNPLTFLGMARARLSRLLD